MAASPKKRLATDTNFPLDLAARKELAVLCWEVLRAKGWSLFLPPTALAELRLLTTHPDREVSDLARKAASELEEWDIQVFPLSDLEESLAESLCRRLVLADLLPAEEWSDGVILGEASLAGMPLLVTSDRHLLHIEQQALRQVFTEADLDFTLPVHRRDIARIVS